jgi:hypothetical protein
VRFIDRDNQGWWYTPVTPVLGRMGQEDYKFESCLGNTVRPSQKKKKKN